MRKNKTRRAPARRGAWTLFTDSLLMILALLSVAFGAVTAYHIEVVSAALWAGAAVLTAVTVTLAYLPRHRLPAVAGAVALWGWGLWRLWKPLVWGGTRIQCDMVNTFAAKLPNVTGIAPVAELPEKLWPQVTTLWILMVGAVYALVLAGLLCRLRRALPVILWTLLPILPALCVTEAPHAVPMAGLLAVWLTLLLTSLTDSRDPKGAARQRLVALLCAMLALQITMARLPTQGTAQPVWAADLREAAINEASRGDISALLTRWSGWMGAGSTEYMNLLGSSPAQTGRVALRISGEMGKYYLRGYSADIYTGRRWEPLGRAAQKELETIRETGVEPLLMLGKKAAESSVYRYESYRNGSVSFVEGDGSAAMEVENVAAPGGCVYYPYGLLELPENAAFGGDSHLERTGAVWEHRFAFVPDWRSVDLYESIANGSSSYYGSSADASITVTVGGGRIPPQRGGEEDPYRDFVYEHELQVPEELRPMLERWLLESFEEVWNGDMARNMGTLTLENVVRYYRAQSAGLTQIWESASLSEDERWSRLQEYYAVGPSREEMETVTVAPEDLEMYRPGYILTLMEMVPECLAQTTRYDRNTPAPPAGRDYVDWFLNESKQGYCMHYATAATLLLRAAGIPARYVSGYVASIPWRESGAEVTDHAAHAWVEVYIDAVGWYPLEATPGFQSNGMGDIPALDSGSLQESAPPRATAGPRPTPTASQSAEDEEDEENEPAPSAAPTPSQAPAGPVGPGGAGEGEPLPPGVRYGVGAVLLTVLAVWGRGYLLRRRREKLRGEATNAAVRYAYACHQRLKRWGGQESQELTALAEKARFSQHTLTAAERDRAAGLFEKEAQRVYGALPGWKKPLFTLWWGKL